MKRFIPFAGVALLASIAVSGHAEIYKYYDSNGNLVLTDTPPKDTPKPAERVETRPVMTIPAMSTSSSPSAPSAPQKASASTAYSIVIQAPAQNETYQRNGGEVIPVAYSVQPSLADGDQLEVQLDGSPMDANSGAISADELERGAHTLLIRVKDENDKVVSSASSTFYIQQQSAMNPNAPKPPPKPKPKK